jgi:hypothetical protein
VEEKKLANCPFCGGEAKVTTDADYHEISCVDCFVTMSNDDLTLGEMMDGWNHRASKQENNIGQKVTSTNSASSPCLCITCSRLLSNGGSCQPNTNSFVTACGGYTKAQQA